MNKLYSIFPHVTGHKKCLMTLKAIDLITRMGTIYLLEKSLLIVHIAVLIFQRVVSPYRLLYTSGKQSLLFLGCSKASIVFYWSKTTGTFDPLNQERLSTAHHLESQLIRLECISKALDKKRYTVIYYCIYNIPTYIYI